MTGWTIHSFFLVRSSMEKGFTLDVITRGAVNSHFPVYWAIFGMVTNKQPGNSSASLLLTSEKVVFCKNHLKVDFTFAMKAASRVPAHTAVPEFSRLGSTPVEIM